jgi:hypothetical protein
MHTPYGMTLDTCPIIITLTTVGESYASKKGFLLDHTQPGEVKTNTKVYTMINGAAEN